LWARMLPEPSVLIGRRRRYAVVPAGMCVGVTLLSKNISNAPLMMAANGKYQVLTDSARPGPMPPTAEPLPATHPPAMNLVKATVELIHTLLVLSAAATAPIVNARAEP